MTSEKNETDARETEQENREWLESLDYVYESQGAERVQDLLRRLQCRAQKYGVGGEPPGYYTLREHHTGGASSCFPGKPGD